MFLARQAALAVTVLFSSQLIASPWIDASDLFLRHHIQQLADAGVITAPVTTYPLMWGAINNDLLKANSKSLSPKLSNSYANVLHYYQRAMNNDFNHQVKVGLASNPKRFTGFGDTHHQKGQLQLSSEYIGSFWAAKLSTQLRYKPQGGQTLTFDNSYLAATYGNWIIRAGAIPQWWGPGWDSSLIMSNNARPLPALSLSRNNSAAFETPWLNWIGPWTFTAQMAKMESSRHVPNALLWSTRATIRPLNQLEIGASWSIQWGGQGQPNSIKDFLKAATSQEVCANGAASCDASMHTKIGNQLAGFDIRWSDSLFGIPFSVYGQTIGEDAVKYIKPADKAYTFGIDTVVQWQQLPIRIFVEYTETQVACGADKNSLNCYYEHGTYYTGYRYHQKSLGTSYDNDAKIVTLGLLVQSSSGHSWHSKVRVGKLNSDNRDRFPNNPESGNTVTKIAEEIVQLELQYQLPLFNGLLSLGADASHSTFQQKSADNTFNADISWQYRY